jgi:hypothetical protein
MTENVNSKIETIQAFIAAVQQDHINGVEVFYRGTDRAYPTVAPSLFRSQSLRNAEKDIFNSMLASHPDSFREDTSTLDKLVRMQHHGLPTRLLDITSNPLVALFFASISPEKRNGDGEVLRFEFRSVDVKYPDSDRAAVMANLAKLTLHQKQQLDTSFQRDAFNQLPSLKPLLHFIRQEKSYFEPTIKPEHIDGIMVIRGKHSNARIIAQSGAFLLFGERMKFEDSPKGRDIRLQKFIIKKDAKESIREELDQLNINQRTLFPSLESTAAYLKMKFDVAPARS